MDLNHYIAILLHRRWAIAITAVSVLLGTFLGPLVVRPTYAAQVTLRVTTVRSGSTDWINYDVPYTDRLINTFARLATSDTTLQELATLLGHARVPKISAEAYADTELLRITAEDTDPALAARAANTLAEILVSHEMRSDTIARYTVSIASPAVTPAAPARPQTSRALTLGLIAGVVSGLFVALLLENIDRRLYAAAEIEQATGLTTLARIPTARGGSRHDAGHARTPSEDAFCDLRTSLLALVPAQPSRVLLVTSAEPGEGASRTVAGLAVAIAQLGQRVVAVDADMRAPSLHTIFGAPNDVGLSSVLRSEATLDEALTGVAPVGVILLPSGPTPCAPAELLASPGMRTVMHELTERFDITLLDTRALLAAPDAAELASMVDGVLLVVGRGLAHQGAVAAARKRLALLNARPVGVVINYATRSDVLYSYGAG